MSSSLFSFVFKVIQPAIEELFKRGNPRKEVQDFASSKGFEYRQQIDPAELGLCDTSFFGRFDVVRDAITGVIESTNFIYFEHDRASGRGDNAVVRSVVAFKAAPTTANCGPTFASDHWMFEKSGAYVFLWRWTEKTPRPVKELQAFVESALRIYRGLSL